MIIERRSNGEAVKTRNKIISKTKTLDFRRGVYKAGKS